MVTLEPMIHSKFLFVESATLSSCYFFLLWISNCSGTILLSSYLLNCFCTFVKNQLNIFVWVYFWIFYSVSFIDFCVYICSKTTRLDYSSYTINLEIGQDGFLPCYQFFKLFKLLQFSCLSTSNFKIIKSISKKKSSLSFETEIQLTQHISQGKLTSLLC